MFLLIQIKGIVITCEGTIKKVAVSLSALRPFCVTVLFLCLQTQRKERIKYISSHWQVMMVKTCLQKYLGYLLIIIAIKISVLR